MGAIKALRHYAIPPKKQAGIAEDVEVDLSGVVPKEWFSNYDELDIEVLRVSYPDGRTCQGGCTDGDYLYRALVESNSEYTTLEKIDLATGEVVLSKTNYSYTHANDMAYCSKDGYLYIAHGSENNTLISKVNKNTLEHVESFTIGSGIWSIAYNEEDNIWVVGVSGGYTFTIYDSDWNFIYRLIPNNIPSGYVKQSIHVDENYIYGIYYDPVNKGGIINIVTYNGMFAKRYRISNINEPEFLAVIGNVFYIGVYDGRDSNDIRNNSIYTATFDMYNGQTATSLRPTDAEGGIGKLSRLPAGTQVCLYRASSFNNSLKIFTSKITPTAFRSIKFVGVGSNQFTTEWFKGGRVRISETNMNDDAGATIIYFREMLLNYNSSNNSFDVEINLTAKEELKDGVVTIIKEDVNDANTTQEFIYISQIWGIV